MYNYQVLKALHATVRRQLARVGVTHTCSSAPRSFCIATVIKTSLNCACHDSFSHPLSTHSILFSPCQIFTSLNFTLSHLFFRSSFVAQSQRVSRKSAFCTKRQYIRTQRSNQSNLLAFCHFFLSDPYSSHNVCQTCSSQSTRQRRRISLYSTTPATAGATRSSSRSCQQAPRSTFLMTETATMPTDHPVLKGKPLPANPLHPEHAQFLSQK